MKRTAPVITRQPPYHYEHEWGNLVTGDVCKVRGERGTFKFDAVAINNITREVDHISFFELDKGGATVCFRSIAVDRVIVPTLKTLTKQRNNKRPKKGDSQ